MGKVEVYSNFINKKAGILFLHMLPLPEPDRSHLTATYIQCIHTYIHIVLLLQYYLHVHCTILVRTLIDKMHFLALKLHFTLYNHNITLKHEMNSYVTFKHHFEEIKTGKQIV